MQGRWRGIRGKRDLFRHGAAGARARAGLDPRAGRAAGRRGRPGLDSGRRDRDGEAADRTGQAVTRLLIADDHPIIIAGLKTLLRDSPYEVVQEVHDGEAVVAAVAADPPDIVILDEAMPHKNGVEVYAELRAGGHK